MNNGTIARTASQSVATIRRIIEQDRRNGPQPWMHQAYGHAQQLLDMAYAMSYLKQCDKLSDHIYILRGVVCDLRDNSYSFGYGD
jgi:hypothetical protein